MAVCFRHIKMVKFKIKKSNKSQCCRASRHGDEHHHQNDVSVRKRLFDAWKKKSLLAADKQT